MGGIRRRATGECSPGRSPSPHPDTSGPDLPTARKQPDGGEGPAGLARSDGGTGSALRHGRRGPAALHQVVPDEKGAPADVAEGEERDPADDGGTGSRGGSAMWKHGRDLQVQDAPNPSRRACRLMSSVFSRVCGAGVWRPQHRQAPERRADRNSSRACSRTKPPRPDLGMRAAGRDRDGRCRAPARWLAGLPPAPAARPTLASRATAPRGIRWRSERLPGGARTATQGRRGRPG